MAYPIELSINKNEEQVLLSALYHYLDLYEHRKKKANDLPTFIEALNTEKETTQKLLKKVHFLIEERNLNQWHHHAIS